MRQFLMHLFIKLVPVAFVLDKFIVEYRVPEKMMQWIGGKMGEKK